MFKSVEVLEEIPVSCYGPLWRFVNSYSWRLKVHMFLAKNLYYTLTKLVYKSNAGCRVGPPELKAIWQLIFTFRHWICCKTELRKQSIPSQWIPINILAKSWNLLVLQRLLTETNRVVRPVKKSG